MCQEGISFTGYPVYTDETLTDVQRTVLKGAVDGGTDPKKYACVQGCPGECVLSKDKDNKLWDVDGVPYTCLTGDDIPEYHKNFCDTYPKSYTQQGSCEYCLTNPHSSDCWKTHKQSSGPPGPPGSPARKYCCDTVNKYGEIQVPISCAYSVNENAGVY